MSDDKMISDEISESDNQVTHHLRYLYNTKADDRQSLAHIRERLLKNSQEALPAIDSLKNSTELPHERLITPIRLHPTRPAERNKTMWSQRLLQLVAVLLIAAITGAFAIVLTLSHTTSGGNIALRPGWQQVAVYSGKGNSTLTGLKQSLPQIWASVVTCNGDDSINTTISEASNEYQASLNGCQSSFTLNQPTYFVYMESPTVVIQTIKVTAHATTSWQVHLLQEIQQPTFHLGSEWKTEGPTPSDNGISGLDTSTHTSTRTWGILMVCFGSGKSYVQLSPNVGNIPMPTCNGQPVLTVLRFPRSVTVQRAIVYPSKDITWSVSIVSCTDESRCQHLPALHVKPEA